MTSFYAGPSGLGSDAPRGVMNIANGPNGHAFGPGASSPTPARPGGGRQYAHWEDLTRIVPELNPLQPMKHLLDDAEKNYSQAEFLRSAGRIDLALQAFIKTFHVTVNIIPRNKEYNSLYTDRKTLGERYNRLRNQVNGSAQVYQDIKQKIKEDNARTGVQPRFTAGSDGATSNGRPSTPKETEVQRGATPTPSANSVASPTRKKPTVQPKPANLHGNSIKGRSTTAAAAPMQSDILQQRLEKLRNTPKQDPRINTRPPLGMNGSAMNGSSQSLPQLSTSLDDVVNMLPKVPDAIYSPARGSISNEAAELPSSTPRGMYSRSNSVIGFYPTQSNLSQTRSSEEQNTPTNDQRSGPAPPPKIKFPLPKGNIITVEELLRYQRIGSKDFSVLLIDVRPRSEYEDGHILSAATICIEPEILQRPGIGARHVEDSMEVGSAEEKRLFESRHSFDLVVIYDQSSENLGSEKSDAPARLFSILTDYDYPEGDPGSKHPKLLKGGLEAWQDSMGAGNLQKASHRRRISAYDKNFLRSPTKPIQNAEEVRRWTQHLTAPKLNDVDSGEEDAFSPVRSIPDFLTRFPPVQESMTSPASPVISPKAQPLPRPDYPALPAEPKRPPPAVPRPSFTGLKPSDDDHGTATRVITKSSAGLRRAVGLQNPNNWCYANSVLQALFASGGFGHELFSNEWEKLYKVPKKADEKSDPPQLMTKMVSNLFAWMGRGNGHPSAPPLKANLLMNYMQHVSKQRPNREVFGSNRQMDSHEFSRLLFTEMHDETNRVRDKEPTFDPVLSSSKCVLEGAVDCWNRYAAVNDSIIAKYWMGLELQIIVCNSCGFRITRAEECDHVVIRPPHRSPTVTMEQLLNEYYGEERLPDYKCDRCEAANSSLRRRLARLPDLFCVMFSRFEFNQGTSSKITTNIDFPHRDLDLTPYSIQGQIPEALLRGDGQPSGQSSIPVIKDHHFTGPFRYEAYAVVQHSGALVGGHYVAIIRDGPDAPDGKSQWHIADDAMLRPHEIGPSRTDKGAQFLHEQRRGGLQAYMVFYQRKDGGLV